MTALQNKIVEIGRSRDIPVFTLDGDAEGAISLNCDYYDGFEDIVRHVVEYHGCRKVGWGELHSILYQFQQSGNMV